MAPKSSKKKKKEEETTTEDVKNVLCPECGENIVDGDPCTECPYDPNKLSLTIESGGELTLDGERYRLTLRKALKRISAQVSNTLIAHEREILDEMDENKPIKIKIPIMVTVECNSEDMSLSLDLTVKRVPLKWAHSDETITIDELLPGMPDLEYGDLEWGES